LTLAPSLGVTIGVTKTSSAMLGESTEIAGCSSLIPVITVTMGLAASLFFAALVRIIDSTGGGFFFRVAYTDVIAPRHTSSTL
jgi:hypothetical protein